MNISVVIPVFNGEATLARCLDSLHIPELPAHEVEIIVVDNNSTDSTREIIRRYPVTYIFEPQRGRAMARNRGINASRGEIVAFIDADCVAGESWLANLIGGFTDTDVAGCGGMIQPASQDTTLARYYASRGTFFQSHFLLQGKEFFSVIATGNAAFRRDLLVKIGLFDRIFFCNEDADLSQRLILAGYQLNFVPEAVVYHDIPKGLQTFILKYFECGKALAYFISKYKNTLGLSFRSQTVFILKKMFQNKSGSRMLDILAYGVELFGLFYGRLCVSSVPVRSFSGKRVEWVVVRVNEAVSFVHTRSGTKYDLNASGSRIVSVLLREKQIDEATAVIAREYGLTSENAHREVMDFICCLSAEGMLHYEERKPVTFAFQVPGRK